MAWTDHAAKLLDGMPSRRRAVVESVFVVVLVLASDLPDSWIGSLVLLVVGAALIAPWRLGRSIPVRALATLTLVVTIVMPVAVAEAMHGAMSASRRIGVAISAVDARPDDPTTTGGLIEVTKIESGAPAQGLLAEGDRIASVDGAPLDRTAPTRDLIARLQNVGDSARLEVVRAHRIDVVNVPVPRPKRGPAAWTALGSFARDNVLAGAVVRAFCVILLVGLMIAADGQRASALGVSKAGLGLDLLIGFPLTAGAFATTIASGLLVQGVAFAFHSKLAEREGIARPTMLLDLFGGTSLLMFALSIAVTASFEEVVFRGFLLPRLRHVTGSWWIAVALGALAFGSGHLYEGWTAVAQTVALGVFFGLAFLFRGRLVPVIVAHASFDVTVFALLTWMQRSGVLEKAKQMLEQQR